MRTVVPKNQPVSCLRPFLRFLATIGGMSASEDRRGGSLGLGGKY